jgi:hypothetical protein
MTATSKYHSYTRVSWRLDTRESRGLHEWQQFMMTIKESGWVLPHPSVRFPRDTLTDIRGWHVHYPGVHLIRVVEYHPIR